MRSVSSTEFVRNPRAVFDQVVATGEPTVIKRHGVPVVRVMPEPKPMTGKAFIALHWGKSAHMEDPEWLADCKSGSGPEEILDPWER